MRLFAAALMAAPILVLGLSAPVRAEVLQKSDAGFIIRNSVEVAKSPAESWAEMLAPAHWWSKAHSWSGDAANLYMDGQAGGCFCELMPVPEGAPEGTRRGSVEHMRVIHADPGKVLRLSGALGPLQGEALTGTLTITFKATPKGARILWEYVVGGYMRFKPDEIAPAVDGMLAQQLARLAAKLGPLQPEIVPEKLDGNFLGDGDKAEGEAVKPDEAETAPQGEAVLPKGGTGAPTIEAAVDEAAPAEVAAPAPPTPRVGKGETGLETR